MSANVSADRMEPLPVLPARRPKSQHDTAVTPQRGSVASELHQSCWPGLTKKPNLDWIDDLTYCRRRLKRGESVYRAGDKFTSIYKVRSGFFKMEKVLDVGREQVTGFCITGEIMGLEGIGTEVHTSNAVALEDSEVCVIPYSWLENLDCDQRILQRHLLKTMSDAIARDISIILILGTLCAIERTSMFLLDVSQRYAAQGYSASEFNLRMSREEIGSYLGMTLETVSRTLSRLHKAGVISVQYKNIRIIDLAALAHCLGQQAGRRAAQAQHLQRQEQHEPRRLHD